MVPTTGGVANTRYVGRFAPSPTGPLHYGSLLAAMASYCDARRSNGDWFLRIDDLDPPREMTGAVSSIQHSLDTFGFEWDGPVRLQSTNANKYIDALERMNESNSLYTCTCSRKQLGDSLLYPGNCRPQNKAELPVCQKNVAEKLTRKSEDCSVRVKVSKDISFMDQIQSLQTFRANKDFGDTILFRRDNLFSYALAAAVDDSDGVTHVVRGSDLLGETAVQIELMELLDRHVPAYAHIPIAVSNDGQKLSKQTKAPALDTLPVLNTLQKAWRQLGQMSNEADTLESFWEYALSHWQLDRVPKQSQLGHINV